MGSGAANSGISGEIRYDNYNMSSFLKACEDCCRKRVFNIKNSSRKNSYNLVTEDHDKEYTIL